MTAGGIYIASHSALDIVSTLNHYERYRRERRVVILISSTAENLQFLQHAGVPPEALRMLRFASRESGGKRSLAQLARQLRNEKRMMDEVAAEIRAEPGSQLIFHSFDDPHFGYLAARLAPTHPVTLVNVLNLQRPRLRLHQLWSAQGLKNIVYRELMNLIFGRLFELRGTSAYPLLVLDLQRTRLRTEPKSAGGSVQALQHYRYRVPPGPRTAFVLYANALGISEAQQSVAYRAVFDRLAAAGWRVFVKLHPQSSRPAFLADYAVEYVPKYVPFEFVDLAGVSLVVGMWGASLLSTGTVTTVSLMPMLYEAGSGHYRGAMQQLAQNPAIRFVSSSTELDALLRGLETPAALRSAGKAGAE
jgi:hypothetical protein